MDSIYYIDTIIIIVFGLADCQPIMSNLSITILKVGQCNTAIPRFFPTIYKEINHLSCRPFIKYNTINNI